MIKLSNLVKDYRMGNSTVRALDNISLEIESGSFLALKGPSGSGKSTLLNILGLIDSPSNGEYWLDGNRVDGLLTKAQSAYRSKYLGFIFQNFNLIPELSVYENIEIPLLINRDINKDTKERIMSMIEEIGLKDHWKHRPGELSGGQQQRVAIGRALIKKSPVILADEPTANLDSKTGKKIMELMLYMNLKYKSTFIFATHDQLVIDFMKEVIFIEDGTITNIQTRADKKVLL